MNRDHEFYQTVHVLQCLFRFAKPVNKNSNIILT